MTRTFSILFVFLFLTSCGKGGSGGSSTPTLTEAELIASDTVPVQAQTFDVVPSLINFERDQEDKIYQAVELIKKVVASPEFKNAVLNHKYKGKKRFVDNSGKSNAEIYKSILEGSEVLTPGNDNTMNLNLESYFVKANVIGYTKPSIPTVFLNRKYLNKKSFSVNQVAMNLMHEWLHKLGYKHAFKATSERKYSVPYGVGYIMRSLAKKHM